MTVKFTRTGVGNESNNEELLFEFLDHELPESVKHKWRSSIKVNKFAGSLQTVQMMGNYYEPISWSGEFFGQYINTKNEYITAKQRADQLHRLQFSLVKFFFEGIKQIVLISEFEYDIFNYQEVRYTITLQPHDITNEIEAGQAGQVLLRSYNAFTDPANDTNKGAGADVDPDKMKKMNYTEGLLKQKSVAVAESSGQAVLDKDPLKEYALNDLQKRFPERFKKFEQAQEKAGKNPSQANVIEVGRLYNEMVRDAAKQDQILNNPSSPPAPLPENKGKSLKTTNNGL